MAENFLLRDLPSDLQDWIGAGAARQRESRQTFVRNALYETKARRTTSLPLPLEGQSIARRVSAEFANKSLPFAFIDLFAGIGGFRFGLEAVGGRCVFTSERDHWSQKTYLEWFNEAPAGDINSIDPHTIPNHDVLAAGFPCQPFSIAGVSKKRSLGMPDGFNCERQGNLFFKIADIVEVKRPPVLFLENVKNLRSHDSGRTWAVIRKTLQDLEYEVFHAIIDARYWVPQHRERIYIVCFDRRLFGPDVPFEFPEPPTENRPRLADILERRPDSKYTLTDHLWAYLQNYAKRQAAKGNGFGFGLPELDGVSRTLSARYFKDGSEILVRQRSGNPRRLTPRECARLMGFPEQKIVVSDTQAYKQFGNAVVPAVVSAIGVQINAVLAWHLAKGNGECLVRKDAPACVVNGHSDREEPRVDVKPRRASSPRRGKTRQRTSQVRLS